MKFGEFPASKRLDALIAIHIFGWTWWYCEKRDAVGLFPPDQKGYIRWNWSDTLYREVGPDLPLEMDGKIYNDFDRCGGWYDPKKHHQAFNSYLPPFSSDYAAMAMLMIKITKSRFWVEWNLDFDNVSNMWNVKIVRWTQKGTLVSERLERRNSLPEGFARCAIRLKLGLSASDLDKLLGD